VEVGVECKAGEFIVKKAVFGRTARRIMDGYVYVKKSVIYGKTNEDHCYGG
jgi:2-methylaconitate cis-trans-isomerase PrpF